MAFESDQSTLAIRHLTLYNNGYGVFEREANVSGRGSIDLFFRAIHMEDVLQSLCCSGSKGIGNISYESARPDAPIALDGSSPLTSLLRSLRGSKIRVELEGGESEEGVIVGVEELHSTIAQAEVPHLTLLVRTGTALRSVALGDITSTSMLDSGTRQDLHLALDLARSQKKKDMQKLTIFYHDVPDMERLRVKYSLHVGEWHSSYRMVFLDGDGRFRLDGFAIFQNTQEEDWNDIQLTLVVGNPKVDVKSSGLKNPGQGKKGDITLVVHQTGGSSFQVQVSARATILDVKRKVEDIKHIPWSQQHLIHAGKGVEDGRTLSDYNIQSGSVLNLVTRVGRATASSESMQSHHKFVMAAKDGLSFYQVTSSVTAKRKQSAIVPLMQAELQGQLVVLYEPSLLKGNALSAILFENTTGRTLDEGSLQVMDDENFLGEGRFSTLAPGDESEPIPYAVEMGCEVTVEHKNKHLHVHKTLISEGNVKLYHYRQQRTTYNITSKTVRRLDFMLNHPFLEGWELFKHDEEDTQPVDITDRVYQFRFFVPPASKDRTDRLVAQKMNFEVREQVEEEETFSISSLTLERLTDWEKLSIVPLESEVSRQIRDVITKRQHIDGLLKLIYEDEQEMREVQEAERRLRENITALRGFDKDSEKYIKQLSAEDNRLKALKSHIKAVRNDKKEKQRQLDEAIEAITFDRKGIVPCV